jgi:inosine-uridine nucleoside N-ribohydrolase
LATVADFIIQVDTLFMQLEAQGPSAVYRGECIYLKNKKIKLLWDYSPINIYRMKTYFLCSLSVLLLVSCGNKKSNETSVPVNEKEVVNLILDTDLGPDYDDVGAMALMHALADSGLVNILATVSSNKDERVIPCIEVLNGYFNRRSVPVGAPKSEGGVSLTTWHKDKWTDYLPSVYEHQTEKTSDAPDAVKVYRRILSEQKDAGVTICTLGFFTNLKDLLLSPGDEYSPLSGKELVAKKVKRLVSMAARFPEGREFNVYCDIPASKTVIGEWPTEIIFSGFEIGEVVLTGKQTAKMPVSNSPVKDTYEMCLKEGDFDGRNSWDQTAVLVAIKGYDPCYTTEKGTVSVDDNGANTWSPSENGKHIRLIEKIPPGQVASLIESYMMHQPVAK